MFQGFTDRTFEFYMAIRFNNNRDFFHENRDWYQEAVREPLVALCEELGSAVSEIDPEADTRPARCIAHINRDIRFSRDKSPYRDCSFMKFRRPNENKDETLGFFFDLSDSGAGWGMGIYDKNIPMMRALSQMILARPEEVQRAIEALDGRFAIHTNVIRRMAIPPQVPEPLRAWYPLRGFYVERETQDFDLIKSSGLAQEIIRDFRLMEPLYTLLMGLEEKENV